MGHVAPLLFNLFFEGLPTWWLIFGPSQILQYEENICATETRLPHSAGWTDIHQLLVSLLVISTIGSSEYMMGGAGHGGMVGEAPRVVP